MSEVEADLQAIGARRPERRDSLGQQDDERDRHTTASDSASRITARSDIGSRTSAKRTKQRGGGADIGPRWVATIDGMPAVRHRLDVEEQRVEREADDRHERRLRRAETGPGPAVVKFGRTRGDTASIARTPSVAVTPRG